jgi:hypothetical protein
MQQQWRHLWQQQQQHLAARHLLPWQQAWVSALLAPQLASWLQ